MNRREFLNAGVAAVAAPLMAARPWGSQQAAPTLPPLPAPGADGWISLFNGRDLNGWYTYLQTSGKDKDPRGYVKVEEGMIHIMGNEVTAENAESGYLATNREFADCRIRVEYKWGVKRFPPRPEAKRDNGLLYSVVGADKVWPTCVECQIQESDVGDVFLLGGTRATQGGMTSFRVNRGSGGAPAPAGGAGAPNAQTAAPARGASNRLLKEGDFENRNDWNVVEVITQGDRAAHIVNGRIVITLNSIQQPDAQNAGQLIPLTRGKIALEIEYAEIWYRKVEIKPLA